MGPKPPSAREIQFVKEVIRAIGDRLHIEASHDPLYDETVRFWLEAKVKAWLAGLDPEEMAIEAKSRLPPTRSIYNEKWLEGAKEVLGLLAREKEMAGDPNWRTFTKAELTGYYDLMRDKIAGPTHMIWRRVNELMALGLVEKTGPSTFRIEGDWIEKYKPPVKANGDGIASG
ncbi:MAG: hypothetical protein QXJ15_03065 [Candidatus Bathyarchaeia archaeon]